MPFEIIGPAIAVLIAVSVIAVGWVGIARGWWIRRPW